MRSTITTPEDAMAFYASLTERPPIPPPHKKRARTTKMAAPEKIAKLCSYKCTRFVSPLQRKDDWVHISEVIDELFLILGWLR